jgi:spore coat protein U-like protein
VRAGEARGALRAALSALAIAFVSTFAALPVSAAPRHVGGTRTTAVPRAVQGELRASDAALGSACSASMAPIAFGATPARGESVPVTVTVVCQNTLRYQLVLNQTGGCAATRALSGPGGTLAYRVLTPQGDTWCDGSAGTAVVAGVGTGQAQTFTATAVIVEDVGRKHAGGFTDTLTGSIEVDP